jgi:hypothetical protein
MGVTRMFGNCSTRLRRRTTRLMQAIALTAVTGGAALALASPAAASENFVIGTSNAAVGTHVTFWGAKWWKLNGLEEGSAPASFKGFANEVNGTCGGTWTTDPGNSSDPPELVPPFIEVLVPSSITKKGRTISGDITSVVLVATEPGYGPNPGHPGTGEVIAVVCGPEGGGGSPG